MPTGIAEARTRPERLNFKNAEGADGGLAGGMIALDEAEGIVTAVVSVTGVEDEVADVIEPGAYRETLVKRRPKVCWAHSWERPIGKVLAIEELLPGDPRLPRQTRDGAPWPAEAGALVATMQFNTKSDAGAEAFAAVEFYSRTGECEYSIGYQVPPGRSTRDRAGVRHIKSLDLYELSVVLFGAHPMTGTLSIKAAYAAAMERKSGRETKAETYSPPQGARDAAQRGLDLRREHGKGGTSVGVARARDLAAGKNLPLATVKRMASFFARHDADKSAEGWGSKTDPSPGYIAWLLWGGDPGRTWAEGIVKREAKSLDDLDDDGLDLDAFTETKAKRQSSDFKACARCGSTEVRDLNGPGQPRCANCEYHLALTDSARKADEGKAINPGEDGDDDGAPDHTDGVMVALYPDAGAADQIAGQISGPDDTTEREDLHVTLVYLGSVGEVALDADEVIERVEGAVEGMGALSGTIGGLGQFPDSGDGSPTWAPVDVPGLGLLREQIAEALGDHVATDHGFTPHMTLGYNIGLIDPITPVDVEFTSVAVVYGTQRHDVALGQGAYVEHRDGPGRKDAYSPDLDTDAGPTLSGMSISDVVRLTAIESLTLDVKAEGGADRNRGGAEKLRRYWTTGEGGAKIAWGTDGDFTRCVGFLSEHMTPERAKGYCANRHKEMNGFWPGDDRNKSTPAATYDPALDLTETKAAEAKISPATAAPSGKGFPYLTGTYEERMNAVREAVVEALRGGLVDESEQRYEWNWIDLRATWDDRVIATRHKWASDEREDWEVTYTFSDDGVELGEPERIELQIVAMRPSDATGADTSPADAYPLATDLLGYIASIKTAHAVAMEAKAGRVLSGRNERRLRAVVDELLAVLRAAGVSIDDPTEPQTTQVERDRGGDQRIEVDPDVDTESTSPTANTKSAEVTLTRADLAAVLADLGIE